MKYIFCYILSLVIFSCSSTDQNISDQESISKDSNRMVSIDTFYMDEDEINSNAWVEYDSSFKKPLRFKDSLNFIDSRGLKQGKWKEYNDKGLLLTERNYVNDTLHGYEIKLVPGPTRDGYYKKGKREGYFRQYYGQKEEDMVMLLTLYENDKPIWYAHPAADENYLIPSKGIKLAVDSAYVIAPFCNGQIWYEGLIVNDTFKGLHKMYKRDGSLFGTIDYDNKKMVCPKGYRHRRYSGNWKVEYLE